MCGKHRIPKYPHLSSFHSHRDFGSDQTQESSKAKFGQIPFRRALSNEDQEAFDRLFDRAKMHTNAGVYMSNPWPMETILMSICLEHGKIIEEILGLLKEKKI